MVGGNREFMLPVALMKVFSDCQYCTGAHNIRQACRVRRARHPRKVRCAVGGCDCWPLRRPSEPLQLESARILAGKVAVGRAWRVL